MLLILALLLAGCRSNETSQAALEAAPRPGALAPDFSVPLLDDTQLSLTQLRGQPLILNFWATWCAPCRREMPRLEAINPEGRVDISLLAVNYGEAAETISAYVNETDVTLPIVLDPDLALARTYLIYGMPTTFFIDAQGVVQAVHTGELTEDILRPLVAKIRSK